MTDSILPDLLARRLLVQRLRRRSWFGSWLTSRQQLLHRSESGGRLVRVISGLEPRGDQSPTVFLPPEPVDDAGSDRVPEAEPLTSSEQNTSNEFITEDGPAPFVGQPPPSTRLIPPGRPADTSGDVRSVGLLGPEIAPSLPHGYVEPPGGGTTADEMVSEPPTGQVRAGTESVRDEQVRAATVTERDLPAGRVMPVAEPAQPIGSVGPVTSAPAADRQAVTVDVGEPLISEVNEVLLIGPDPGISDPLVPEIAQPTPTGASDQPGAVAPAPPTSRPGPEPALRDLSLDALLSDPGAQVRAATVTERDPGGLARSSEPIGPSADLPRESAPDQSVASPTLVGPSGSPQEPTTTGPIDEVDDRVLVPSSPDSIEAGNPLAISRALDSGAPELVRPARPITWSADAEQPGELPSTRPPAADERQTQPAPALETPPVPVQDELVRAATVTERGIPPLAAPDNDVFSPPPTVQSRIEEGSRQPSPTSDAASPIEVRVSRIRPPIRPLDRQGTGSEVVRHPAPLPSGPRTEGQEPRSADDLFLPTSDDRSPAAWLARLTGPAPEQVEATAPESRLAAPAIPGDPSGASAPIQRQGSRFVAEPLGTPRLTDRSRGQNPGLATTWYPAPVAPLSPEPRVVDPSTVPVPETVRTFLRPLLGIDPADVRVFYQPRLTTSNERFRADAVTVGQDVVLGERVLTDSPESIGLLAHELSHVASNRSPGFLPPIIAAERQVRRDQGEPIAPVDSETVARQVESRVVQAVGSGPPPVASDRSAALPAAAPSDSSPIWGTLPAPWEPLPAWVTQPVLAPGSAPPVPAVAAGESPIQFAETDRPVESAVESAETPVQRLDAPSPDLDQLARQVYDILKRRLGAERRRYG